MFIYCICVESMNSGPDSELIYAQDGYTTYLPKNFPLLDSIQNCYIVDEVGLYTTEEL